MNEHRMCTILSIMKTNEILNLLDAVIANANIFSVRPNDAFIANSRFADAIDTIVKLDQKGLESLKVYGRFSDTFYREFELAFSVSCSLHISPVFEAEKSRNSIVPRVSFKCQVNWPSSIKDLSSAAASVALYQQVVTLAQRIEALGSIRLEA